MRAGDVDFANRRRRRVLRGGRDRQQHRQPHARNGNGGPVHSADCDEGHRLKVPCEESKKMAEQMARAGVEHELILVPGGGRHSVR